MKTKLSIAASIAVVALLGLALSSTSQAQPATAVTAPVGYTTLPIPAGTSVVVPTLTNVSVFTGLAAISADGLTITPGQAPGWTAGDFNETAFSSPTPNYPTHYAEVIAGGEEGLVNDIMSNSTTALTLAAAAPVGIRGTTVQIAVREHMTLDKAFAGATGLSAFQDSVTIFNSGGSPSLRFYDGASFLDDAFSNPAGHTVVYPGQGFTLSAAGPVSLLFVGGVKVTKTQVPLYAGATNVVGPLSPASSTLLVDSTELAAALTPYLEGFNEFSADGTMTTVSAYFSDGMNILDAGFNPLPPTATDAIDLNRGVVISVEADTVWTVPAVQVGP